MFGKINIGRSRFAMAACVVALGFTNPALAQDAQHAACLAKLKPGMSKEHCDVKHGVDPALLKIVKQFDKNEAEAIKKLKAIPKCQDAAIHLSVGSSWGPDKAKQVADYNACIAAVENICQNIHDILEKGQPLLVEQPKGPGKIDEVNDCGTYCQQSFPHLQKCNVANAKTVAKR